VKVLVTGGAGFIGSHVVDSLIDHGHQVVVVDDLSTGKEENINPEVKFYKMNIRDPEMERIFTEERPDVLNHHAAQMSVNVSVARPLFDAEVNVLGSLNLIELCKKHGVKRFIYISTGGAVYGEPRYLPCDEAHPVDPLSQYGVTKHTVEHYLYLYRFNYGLDYIILRYPNVYGPRQDPYGEAGVVAIFTGQMLKGQQVVINGDGNQERDFVYIDDVVRANLIALTIPFSELRAATKASNGRSDNFVYNLGSGKGTSVNRIFEELRQIIGYQREPVHGPPREGEVYKICLEASKAEKALGWRPKVGLREGLKKTVAWFEGQIL